MLRNNLYQLVALFLAIALQGCGTSSARKIELTRTTGPNAKSEAHPLEVNVAEAVQTAPAGPLMLPASVTVEDVAEVLTPAAGQLLTLNFQEGQRVERGAILAQLSDEDTQNQLRQMELDVQRSQVEEKQFEASVNLSRTELEREKLLFKEDVSSRSQVEQAEFRLSQTQQEFQKIKLATQLARSRVATVRSEIERRKIRAPVDGVIIKRFVSLGSTVTAGQKLCEISGLAPFKIKFQVPQTASVHPVLGQLVGFSLVGSQTISGSARVSRVAPVADAANYTFGYVADVVSGGAGLQPGAVVNIQLLPAAGESYVAIPRNAFPPDVEPQPGQTATVIIVENNRCFDRLITVKSIEGDQVRIASGLLGGDKVIIAPPPNLKTGDAVTVR